MRKKASQPDRRTEGGGGGGGRARERESVCVCECALYLCVIEYVGDSTCQLA